MKKTAIITMIFFCIISNVFAEELYYDVHTIPSWSDKNASEAFLSVIADRFPSMKDVEPEAGSLLESNVCLTFQVYPGKETPLAKIPYLTVRQLLSVIIGSIPETSIKEEGWENTGDGFKVYFEGPNNNNLILILTNDGIDATMVPKYTPTFTFFTENGELTTSELMATDFIIDMIDGAYSKIF